MWIIVDGVVQSGHGVASGQSATSPYPAGTIAMQTPYFKARGLDLSAYYPGTINVSIAPHFLDLEVPAHTFADVTWASGFGAETFSFSPCFLRHDGSLFNAMVYYPHPETKIDHLQDRSIVEILAPKLEGIAPGVAIQLHLNLAEVAVLLP
jgi:hypothetical protein